MISGDFGIEFRDGKRPFGPGELVVEPKGMEHPPDANGECHILMIDREGEPNTGGQPSEYTRAELKDI